MIFKRGVAVLLSASLIGLSAGPCAWEAAAAQTTASRGRVSTPGTRTVPVLTTFPQLSAPSPMLAPALSPTISPAPLLAAPRLAPSALPQAAASAVVPQLPASAVASLGPIAAPEAKAAATPFEASMQRLAAPALDLAAPEASSSEGGREQAGRDFEKRIGAGEALSGAVSAEDLSAVPAGPGLSRATSRGAVVSGREVARPAAIKEKRSTLFPLAVAAGMAVVGGAVQLLAWAGPQALGSGDAGVVAGVVSAVAFVALGGAVVAAAAAVVDAALLGGAVWRGRKVTDESFRAFVRKEVMDGRLDAGVAELLRVHRPEKRFDLDWGYASGGLIYVRPELAASPFLFRQVVLHEMNHLRQPRGRAPPVGRLAALARGLVSELKARAAELRGAKGLRALKVPTIERVLRQAQLSLRMSQPYDLLVLNAGQKDFADAKVYESLSGGSARVEAAQTAAPHELLSESSRAGRFGAVVLDRASEVLPEAGSKDEKRLDLALRQLDSLYVLATRQVARPEPFSKQQESSGYLDLVDKARALDKRDARQLDAFEKQVRKFWREIASSRLKDMPAAALIDGLYGSLRHKGVAFLSFDASDKGVAVWERLLRFWEAEEGGQFRVTRVDLEDGSHVLVLRKIESRVGLWLKPQKNGRIETSVPNVWSSPEAAAKGREAMIAAGLESELDRFASLGVEIRHVFGADVGRQEIYVTIPRRNAAHIRKLVSGSSVNISDSETFYPQLDGSGELHGAKPLWDLGDTGKSGTIFWIDTGADATHGDFGGRLEVVDMVGEGPEDWIGHGSHVAGISISGHDRLSGMAYGAKGIMAKVFSRDAAGASDGDIMAAGVVALQRGADVINLSLGSRGSSSDNLAMFFSDLARKKNAKGNPVFITASQGNSGPVDMSGSQPAQGEELFATGSGGVNDKGHKVVRFYSSVGPDVDRRYAIARRRIKPSGVVKGGNVTTRPGSSDVYEEGVVSVKSKDTPRGPSDTDDGLHTRLSGTSMASPMLAGLAMLVIESVVSLLKLDDEYFKEHRNEVVAALSMRAAEDMSLPVWFQGAGWVTAWAAVSLAAKEAGVALKRRFGRILRLSSTAPAVDPWAWVKRYRSVISVEDSIYREAEVARGAAESRFDEGATEDPEAPPEDRSAVSQQIANETYKRFSEAAERALPGLLEALKDPVWLVRRQAAMVLLNLKLGSSALALADAAIKDEDARVRQMALLALAEIPTHAVDVLLGKAADDARPEVGLYAAYALARHGDRRRVDRLLSGLKDSDERVRFTAAWLLGQLSRRSSPEETEALSSIVKSESEEGEVRHVAAAALFNIASDTPAALSDRAILDLLQACGPQNLALARTIAKVFPPAAQNKAFAARLRQAPLRQPVTEWVLSNRGAVLRPGALGELVSLLARVLDISLDQPTPQPDPSGQGVSGVDPALGALDLIVELKGGVEPDAAFLSSFEAERRASVLGGKAVWVSVPEHKVFAFSLALRQLGHAVRGSSPFYGAARKEGGDAFAGATIDLGSAIEAPEGADLSLVRLLAPAGVSEARLLAALEALKARKPRVVVLPLAGPRAGLVGKLIDELVLSDILVVTAAGNTGPSAGTVSSLSRSLAITVAAAGRALGLADYSGRGTPDRPAVTWTDTVDDLKEGLPSLAELAAKATRAAFSDEAPAPATPSSLQLGTGAAAEMTAMKLAILARRMSAVLGELPAGWTLYLQSVVRKSLAPIPGRHAYEVGAGLFDNSDAAMSLLDERLKDPVRVVAESQLLAQELRSRRAAASNAVTTAVRLAASATRKSGLLGLFDIERAAAAAASELTGAGEQWSGRAGTEHRRGEVVRLKQVLGDGVPESSGYSTPFRFDHPNGWKATARSAGLEGFLYSKLEIERHHGGMTGQLKDFFAYVDALLAPVPSGAALRKSFADLKSEKLSPEEKNARFNALLIGAVRELRGRLGALDASAWGRRNATYMVFSRAYNRAKPGKTFFESFDDAELKRIRDELHMREIWLMDLFEIGEINRWGTGGGSSYALKGYEVKKALGGEAGMRDFTARAHALGLKVKVDFIPNHFALDSKMVSERPEAVIHLVPPQDLTDEQIMAALPRHHDGHARYWLVKTDNYPEDGKRVSKRILVHHPRTDYADGMWRDMAQIDYSRPEARQWMTDELKRLFLDLGVDSVRRDMAYYVLSARYFEEWGGDNGYLARELRELGPGWLRDAAAKQLEGFRARRDALKGAEFISEATEAVKLEKPEAVMIDEAYTHALELSRAGSDGIYNKADFDLSMGQTGLYDAMVSRDAVRIGSALRHAAFRRWQRGAAPAVNFIGTHDGGEGNPVDKFGKVLMAAAATALLLRPVLFYNGLEQGVGQKDNLIGDLSKSTDREKAIPMDIPVSIDWSKSDTQRAEALKRVLAAGERHADLLDRGAMEVLEPVAPTGIVAFSVAEGAGKPALIVAANWSENATSGSFTFKKPVLKDFGAFQPDAKKRYLLRDLANLGPDGQPLSYERTGRELSDSGLSIRLSGGAAHIFEVTEL